MFDKCVLAAINGPSTEKIRHPRILHDDAEMHVLVFLDRWFKEENIEIAPNAVGVHQGMKYMRKKWKQLYEEYYIPDMKKLDLPHVQRNAFCEIRLRQRSNYERHRKVNNKKWDHLECPDCVHLEEYYEVEKDPSKKSVLKRQLDDHYAAFAQRC